MLKKTYDSIVVGTGAGGGMAIKTLCEAGLKVVALNAGRRVDPAKDFRRHKQRYDMKYRGFGDPKTRHIRYHDENEYTEGLWEHDVTYTTALPPAITAPIVVRVATQDPSFLRRGLPCPMRKKQATSNCGRMPSPKMF